MFDGPAHCHTQPAPESLPLFQRNRRAQLVNKIILTDFRIGQLQLRFQHPAVFLPQRHTVFQRQHGDIAFVFLFQAIAEFARHRIVKRQAAVQKRPLAVPGTSAVRPIHIQSIDAAQCGLRPVFHIAGVFLQRVACCRHQTKVSP